jgi:hypothetical protein
MSLGPSAWREGEAEGAVAPPGDGDGDFGEAGVDEDGVVAAEMECAGDAGGVDVQGAGGVEQVPGGLCPVAFSVATACPTLVLMRRTSPAACISSVSTCSSGSWPVMALRFAAAVITALAAYAARASPACLAASVMMAYSSPLSVISTRRARDRLPCPPPLPAGAGLAAAGDDACHLLLLSAASNS